MSTQLSFMQKLASDLIKSKHNNYSQECLSNDHVSLDFYIDQHHFSIQDIQRLQNFSQERLKCSLIKHKQNPHGVNGERNNSKCIIYLHGFGSSRLQALSLVEQLPLEYCLCIFDFSGSGKSEGEKITYGLKEQQDIGNVYSNKDPIIAYLAQRKHIREFVIWGRSMGAVAALLYAIERQKMPRRNVQRRAMTATQSLKNSIVLPSRHRETEEEEVVIHALVLDSPFFKFSEIAKEIAQKKFMVPSFLLDMALGYVEESFKKILTQSIGERYNPFLINFDQKIKINIPAIFVYSETDEVIAPSHSERLMRNMDSRYRKIMINCTHNQARPRESIRNIFNIIEQFSKVGMSEQRRLDCEASKEMTVHSANKSLDRKRGINVFTPSKELKKEHSNSRFHQTITIDVVKTQEIGMKSPRYRSNSKRGLVTLQSNKKTKKGRQLDTASTEMHAPPPKMHSIELQVNKILNKKLLDPQQQKGLKMTRANKRYGYDKRKDLKFSHQKYTE